MDKPDARQMRRFADTLCGSGLVVAGLNVAVAWSDPPRYAWIIVPAAALVMLTGRAWFAARRYAALLAEQARLEKELKEQQ